jgi:hypothetical protein
MTTTTTKRTTRRTVLRIVLLALPFVLFAIGTRAFLPRIANAIAEGFVQLAHRPR